jgi:hypothetical protein
MQRAYTEGGRHPGDQALDRRVLTDRQRLGQGGRVVATQAEDQRNERNKTRDPARQRLRCGHVGSLRLGGHDGGWLDVVHRAPCIAPGGFDHGESARVGERLRQPIAGPASDKQDRTLQ